MRNLFVLALLTLTACGQARTTATGHTDEPNALTVKPSMVGVYDVAATSSDPNCVWNDTTWTIDRTATDWVYRVNTEAEVSYVASSDVPQKGETLAWSQARYYTVQGCYYSVSFDYTVSLDSDANLTGVVLVKPDATCGRATVCQFALSSQRITADDK